MSTLKADTIQSTGGGAATLTKQFAAKVWVNFDQNTTAQDSENVSSLTDNAAGDYTVNFTNAMSNANYAYNGTASNWEAAGNTDSYMGVSGHVSAQAAGSHRIITYRERYDVHPPQFKDPYTTTMVVHGDLA